MQHSHSKDSESNPQDCTQTKNHGSPSSAAQPTARKLTSERKRHANRENAKKSTGPKTAGGKRYSSFNSVKHGLLAKKVMYAADGQMNEDLKRVFESLRDEYARGDIASELLAELASVDYWRLQKGLEYELKYLTPRGGEFHPQGAMPSLLRYMTANRRAFERSLTTLMQLRQQNGTTGDAEAQDDSDLASSTPPEKKAPSGGTGAGASAAKNEVVEVIEPESQEAA